MSTFCPAWIFAFRRKYNADTPPNKTAAASSKLMFTGFFASKPSSGTHTYSAWAPNLTPGDPNTWSPAAKRVTALPTDSTVPANSIPNILTFFGRQRPFINLARNGSTSLGAVARTPNVNEADGAGVWYYPLVSKLTSKA